MPRAGFLRGPSDRRNVGNRVLSSYDPGENKKYHSRLAPAHQLSAKSYAFGLGQRASTVVPIPPRGRNSPLHHGPHWVARLHHIFQHLVHNVLLENTEISVTEKVLLQRLQLQASFARHVADGELSEIRQSSLWTNRCQLRIVNLNLVAGKLVLPGLNRRKSKVQSGLGVFVCVAALGCHEPYCTSRNHAVRSSVLHVYSSASLILCF